MGLITLPEVGAGEALGPTKRNRALQTPDATRDIDADEWNAAAVALEGVCAEVGLANGTTPGSLVARVTALEDAPPGSGGGDVVGPASSTDNAIATFDSTTGKIIQDSGISAASVSGHIASTSNPHNTTAAQVGADPKLAVQTAHTAATLTLTDADHNKHRPLNTASNSIAISIPTTLTFPFVWTARKSSASNSVTITTGDAALITPKVSGTVPVTAVDAYITIFAESATVAAVFVTVPA